MATDRDLEPQHTTRKNIVSPKFRGSFVFIMKPRQKDDDGEPQYEMAIVLPKDDRETKDFIGKLEDAFEDAMTEKIGKIIPFEKCKHYPIRDGDDMEGEEFHGCWVVGTKNKKQPGVLIREEDGTRRAVERESEIYSGAYYHASVRAYAWDNKFGKGVSVSLEGVLKVEDGEKFGSSFSEDDFDSVSKGNKSSSSRDREERRPSRDRDEERKPSREDRPRRRSDDDEPPF